jgi:hypothetical protein
VYPPPDRRITDLSTVNVSEPIVFWKTTVRDAGVGSFTHFPNVIGTSFHPQKL